jgi:hypothetical protein
VVVGLKIINEYIAGVITLEDSIPEFHTQLTASQNMLHQNFVSRYSFVNHHVINLLYKLIGHSQVIA